MRKVYLWTVCVWGGGIDADGNERESERKSKV